MTRFKTRNDQIKMKKTLDFRKIFIPVLSLVFIAAIAFCVFYPPVTSVTVNASQLESPSYTVSSDKEAIVFKASDLEYISTLYLPGGSTTGYKYGSLTSNLGSYGVLYDEVSGTWFDLNFSTDSSNPTEIASYSIMVGFADANESDGDDITYYYDYYIVVSPLENATEENTYIVCNNCSATVKVLSRLYFYSGVYQLYLICDTYDSDSEDHTLKYSEKVYIELTGDTYGVDIPTKDGYDFTGWWYTGEDGTTTRYTGTAITEDMELNAGWHARKYNVVYCSTSSSILWFSYGVTHGSNYTIKAASSAVTKEHYSCVGWATAENATEVEYTAGATVTGLTTEAYGTVCLYPVWNLISYTVEFNSNGGTGTMTAKIYDVDTTYNLPENTFTKEHYTFAGWSMTSTGEVKYADEATVSNLTTTSGASVTLYAVWTLASYTVTYDANDDGGSFTSSAFGTVASQTFNVGGTDKKTLTSETFTREGYTFLGWSTEKDATTATYEAGSSFTKDFNDSSETVTLYAVWEIKTYTITFYVDGAEYKKITVAHGSTLSKALSAANISILSYYVESTSSGSTDSKNS